MRRPDWEGGGLSMLILEGVEGYDFVGDAFGNIILDVKKLRQKLYRRNMETTSLNRSGCTVRRTLGLLISPPLRAYLRKEESADSFSRHPSVCPGGCLQRRQPSFPPEKTLEKNQGKSLRGLSAASARLLKV